VHELLQRYPEAKVVGHRDLSPDTNYNGIVDPWERIKECPCFEVIGEFSIN
ncbi:N-acetylmuramoyl-L-alanine amidase, partial [Bacteroides thetaiotaomicron]